MYGTDYKPCASLPGCADQAQGADGADRPVWTNPPPPLSLLYLSEHIIDTDTYLSLLLR